jgi:hypothetical protein
VSLATACAVPAAVFALLATVASGAPPYEAVAARIESLAPPSASMFVWGNSPQLYVAARRAMGTRFSFCNYMTGESPGTPTETGERNADANILADSWTMLIDDLDRRRPLLFVDAAAAGWDGYEKFPVTRYPRLVAYLGMHYRKIDTVRGVVIYRRTARTM